MGRRRSLSLLGLTLAGTGLLVLSAGPTLAQGAADPSVGQCLPTQQIATGISLSCLVQPTSSPSSGQPAAGTRIHSSDIDLTAPGVAPVVVLSNDTVFQPVPATPSPTGTPDVNETVTSMADRTAGVVVGVNGGYFDNDKGLTGTAPDQYTATYTGIPCGGVVSGGQILRSPSVEPELNASVYTRADGSLGIGNVSFAGTVQVLDQAGALLQQAPLDSINDLSDAFPQPGCPRDHVKTESAGTGITMLTSAMGPVLLQAADPAHNDPGYAVPSTTDVVQVTAQAVVGSPSAYVVTSSATTSGLQSIDAVSAGEIVLVASTHDGTGEGAFLASLPTGAQLQIPTALAVGTDGDALSEGAQIVSLLGGVAPIVVDGSIPSAPVGYVPSGNNAETLLAIDGSGTHATLMVIDDAAALRSPGVTWSQAAQAALDHGATDALLLDGGGSSTLAAQLSTPAVYSNGQPSRLTVVNTPANDGNFPEGEFTQRLVGNGLFFTGAILHPAPTPTATPALAATGSAAGIATDSLLGGALLVVGLGRPVVVAVRRRVAAAR